jgi:putative SOS response-associated peptidase YedK
MVVHEERRTLVLHCGHLAGGQGRRRGLHVLTMPPGPDIAPYDDRQIAILDRADWAGWLDPSVSAKIRFRAALSPSTRWANSVVRVRLRTRAGAKAKRPALPRSFTSARRF